MKRAVGSRDDFPWVPVECRQFGYSGYGCVLQRGHKSKHVATDGTRIIDIFSSREVAEVRRTGVEAV